MELKIKTFDELTTRELYEIAVARNEIFLMEQRIICRDLDGVDYRSLHCFIEDEGKVMAYLRAFKKTDESDTCIIGRVLSLKHKIGLGKRIMSESLKAIKEHFRCKRIILHSQKHAQGFYEKLGFYVTSDDFLEEGVVHVEMALDFDV